MNIIRPFPEAAIIEALRGKKNVIILERTDEGMAGDNPMGRVNHRLRAPVARAFMLFYAAVTVLVLASLLLTFFDVVPDAVSPQARAVFEYVESMVGFYGVMLTLPILAHRVFAVPGHARDRVVVVAVGVALIIQHVTEYGLGGRWDDRGDLLENLVFSAAMIYTLALGVRRRRAPGVDARSPCVFSCCSRSACPCSCTTCS